MRTITLLIVVLLLGTTGVVNAWDGKSWDSKSHSSKSGKKNSWSDKDFNKKDKRKHSKKRHGKSHYGKKGHGKLAGVLKESRVEAKKVCDSLKTPGSQLYGLCVSYCQVRDLGTAFSSGKLKPKRAEKISRYKERLLARYNERKGEDDPGMPCIATLPTTDNAPAPAAVCPCWTSNQVANLSGASCVSQDQATFKTDEATTPVPTAQVGYMSLKALSISQDNGASFTNYCTNEETVVDPLVDPNGNISMMQEVSDGEYANCRREIQSICP